MLGNICRECGGPLILTPSLGGEDLELVCQNCGLVYQRDDRGLGSYITESDIRKILRRQPSEVVLETARIRRKCRNCGKEFYVKRANQLYCSSICKYNAKSKRFRRKRSKLRKINQYKHIIRR